MLALEWIFNNKKTYPRIELNWLSWRPSRQFLSSAHAYEICPLKSVRTTTTGTSLKSAQITGWKDLKTAAFRHYSDYGNRGGITKMVFVLPFSEILRPPPPLRICLPQFFSDKEILDWIFWLSSYILIFYIFVFFVFGLSYWYILIFWLSSQDMLMFDIWYFYIWLSSQDILLFHIYILNSWDYSFKLWRDVRCRTRHANEAGIMNRRWVGKLYVIETSPNFMLKHRQLFLFTKCSRKGTWNTADMVWPLGSGLVDQHKVWQGQGQG